MVQGVIENLLRKKIGLEPSTIGSSKLAKAVAIRQEACGLPDLSSYLKRLQTSNQELEELIESVIVPETWFFRDKEPFAFLSRHVKFEWWPNHRNRGLRVLSVPCSTGEEPYSIAITLIEAGLQRNHFRIDAVDISKRALIKAKRGVYSKNSFRGEDFPFRKRYFHETTDGYQLCESISHQVNFIHGNLVDPFFLIDRLPYDIIFCRNVLIYLEQAARARVIKVLERLLSPTGLLFVGYAETGQMMSNGFVSVRHPLAFAYRKVEQVNKMGSAGNGAFKTGSDREPEDDAATFIQQPHPKKRNVFASTDQQQHNPEPISEGLLETARRLADHGQLNEAATLCETYLRNNTTSAHAYVLLGEVLEALGNEVRAEQCFHKAIYLEPNYYEALIHLALLKEHRGDIAGAAVIQQRLERLLKSQSK